MTKVWNGVAQKIGRSIINWRDEVKVDYWETAIPRNGVANRMETEEYEGKKGMGAFFGEDKRISGGIGHFRGWKSRAVGRLLHDPEEEEGCKGVEDRDEYEKRKAILLYRATEYGVEPVSRCGAIRHPDQAEWRKGDVANIRIPEK